MEKSAKEFERNLQRLYGDRSTPKHYMSDLKLFIEHTDKRIPEQITSQDIDGFIDAQLSRGLQSSSINRRLASLHTFFEYLASLEPDKATPNPVKWRRHRIKEREQLPRDASEADVERLFAFMEHVRDKAIFGLMIGAGLRVGEVVDLRLTNLEAPTEIDESARLRVWGKGRKERIVWITPRWYQPLEVWLSQRPQSESDHLFLNQHRRSLSVSGVQYRLNQLCQKAGVKLTCHQLRHTFARRLAEQQMPTESIGQLLGHKQIATTQRYTIGANPEVRNEFLDIMKAIENSEIAHPPEQLPQRPSVRPKAIADTDALEKAITRFAPLPFWLRQTLVPFLRYRWRDWQAHRAEVNAHAISRQLLQIWQWFVSHRRIKSLESLSRSDVEAWLEARQAQGIAVNTQRTQLTLLLSTLRFALDQDLEIAANIFRISPPARPEPLPRYLSEQEYHRFLHAAHEATADGSYRNLLDRTWLLTLAHTGLRTCELLELRLSDLDLHARSLYVTGGKNARERIVFLTPTLVSALTLYLQLRPQVEDTHLWIDQNTRPLTSNRVKYCVHLWAKSAGVSCSPHRLRHTLATQLINRGMPLTSVANLLGHKTINTTQHYARLYDQTVKNQFHAAVAHIDGIAATYWPTSQADLTFRDSKFEHSCDSV